MLSWILQITIISIVLIFLVHYLFNFFKSTLTIPKIKDLVNTPTQKYESMFNVISKSNSANMLNETTSNNEYSLTDLLPKSENDMKSELKNFLKKQLNTTTSSASSKNNININSTTPISGLDSMMSYSEF